MSRLPVFALLGALIVLSGGVVGQDKKDDPKSARKDETKKDEPPTKVKGFLPQNWGKLGLSDDQKQEVYRIQNKYNSEIDRLEAKIAELKKTRDKEMRGVLTPDQKKRLDDILTGKDK